MNKDEQLLQEIDELLNQRELESTQKSLPEPAGEPVDPSLGSKLGESIDAMVRDVKSKEAISLKNAIAEVSKAVMAGFSSLKEATNQLSKKEVIFPDEQDVRVINGIKIVNLKDIPQAIIPKSFDINKPQWLETLIEEVKKKEEVPEKEEKPEYVFIVDTKPTNKVYIGYAKPGTKEDEKAWQIKRVMKKDSGFASEFADGNPDFDNAWSKRGLLEYT